MYKHIRDLDSRPFHKSSFCTDAHGCVEVDLDGNVVKVRDGKAPGGRVLFFDRAEWAAFVAGVKAGEFDA
jgi:hypothetical protein